MLAGRQPSSVAITWPRGRGYPRGARPGVWLPHLPADLSFPHRTKRRAL